MAETEQQQKVPFLPFSNAQIQDLGSQAYAVTGGRLTFTSLAGRMGMADGAFITIRGTVTPTLGAGAALWSTMRSLFRQVTVSQGGKTYKQFHPVYLVTRLLTERRLYNLNASLHPGGDAQASPFYAANLGGSLPALVGAAALPFVFTFYLPFRWRRNLLAGMFPIGDSTRPLVIDLDLPTAGYGVDPQNFPVIVSGGATVAFAATVEASLVYREVLPYRAGIAVAQPVVGTQLRVSQLSTAITGVGAEFSVPQLDQTPHAGMFSYIQDGNANAAAGAGVNGSGLTTLNVSRMRYTLTSQAPVLDLDTPVKLYNWLLAQRLQYGVDLPDGFFPIKFGEDDHSTGFNNDPNDDTLWQLPDFSVWANSLIGVTLTGAINGAGAGLARILTVSEWLEPAGY